MVTDRARYRAGSGADGLDRLIDAVGRAARAGVDLIQIRERDLPDRRLFELVRQAIDAVRDTGARVLVNDRADIAIASGAAGVHLRSTSPPAVRLRRMAPHGFLVGRSVHSRQEADLAIREGGCDYLLFGTIFQSGSKPAAHPVIGVDALRALCQSVPLPVVAIGGINEARAPEVAAAGAAGIAAIELFAHGSEETLCQTVRSVHEAFARVARRT